VLLLAVCGLAAIAAAGSEKAVASGSCGVPHPSLVPYVTVTGAADAATASGGRSCCLSACSHRWGAAKEISGTADGL